MNVAKVTSVVIMACLYFLLESERKERKKNPQMQVATFVGLLLCRSKNLIGFKLLTFHQ